MKTAPFLFFLLMSLAAFAQGDRKVYRYVLDWSSKTGQMTLTHSGDSGSRKQVFRMDSLDAKALHTALDLPANTKALLYIHCWLGETRFFHRRSMDWLTNALQASADTTPVALLALRWQSGKRGYRHSANRAGGKGMAAAPLLSALGQIFPDHRLDVFCHSMGNRFFQGILSAMKEEEMPALGRVVLFSPDVDADVFCGDFGKLAAVSSSLHVYTHRHDRALWMSKKLLHRARLGRSGPTDLPDGVLLDIIDMTRLRSASNHTHFSKKEIQRDLGRVYGLEYQAVERRRVF